MLLWCHGMVLAELFIFQINTLTRKKKANSVLRIEWKWVSERENLKKIMKPFTKYFYFSKTRSYLIVLSLNTLNFIQRWAKMSEIFCCASANNENKQEILINSKIWVIDEDDACCNVGRL